MNIFVRSTLESNTPVPPLPSSLPILSDDELERLFEDDVEAIRRYRLLHAVLVLGVSQREAAAQQHVSERTVRNVLSLYRRGTSLEALRSRRSAARRGQSRRWDTFEPALSAALAEDPTAGGDKVWRRAQVLLGPNGNSLSRRTAYRVLAKMRAESRRSAEPQLFNAVRSALPLLPEDPPLALGNSALAQRLLPEESNPLLRGTLLQQAIRTALDRLRPAGSISGIDRSWWPYLICTGEYETGQSRGELQDDLALSPSTYSRAKRQGISQIAVMLPRIIEPMVEVPTVLASQRLPRTADFVGRHDEQAYYAWRLQTEGQIHIWGLPGSGKTALAAELAADGRRYGQMVLWHSCRPGAESSVFGVIEGLGQALASTGDNALWQTIRQQPHDRRDIHALIDLLRERLLARPAVIVIDDLHRTVMTEGAPLFAMLQQLISRRAVRLVLIRRSRTDGSDFAPLPGLSDGEARRLWTGLTPLPEDQWHALYDMTGGLPQPLRRVIAAYRRAGDHARPDDWRGEVAGWAEDAIWQRLGEEDRRLLTLVHVLRDRSWVTDNPPLLGALDISLLAWERLQQNGLISVRQPRASIHNVVRSCVESHLRDNATLRTMINALSDTIVETTPLAAAVSSQDDIVARTGGEAAAPTGMELLSRVRDALEQSAKHLQHNMRDSAVQRLLAELATLQAALPDPSRLARNQRASA